MPTEREEAEDLATRYRQQYAKPGGLEPASTGDDCVCGCSHVVRDHLRTSSGIKGCLMAGCSCSQFKHKIAQVEE
jgi:hypothetical protein